VDTAAIKAGFLADQAAKCKLSQYLNLLLTASCSQLRLKTSVPLIHPHQAFYLILVTDKIRASSGEDKKLRFFQRMCVLIERFNSVLLHDSFTIAFQT